MSESATASARQVQPHWDLAYLFAAHFADGSQILQTPEDRSATEPDTRSAYYDVVQRIASGAELVSFALYSADRVYAVDLRDGHFEFKILLDSGGIITIPFSAQPVAQAPQLPPPASPFRLVYCRDHQQDILSSASGSVLGEHRVSYRLGWEYDALVAGELRTFAQTIVVG